MKRSLQKLMIIPGIGKKIAQDLWELGIKSPSDLKNKNPEFLYQRLCNLHAKKLDRCLLYVFRCAVYYVEHKNPDPEKLKWWYWKD